MKVIVEATTAEKAWRKSTEKVQIQLETQGHMFTLLGWLPHWEIAEVIVLGRNPVECRASAVSAFLRKKMGGD